MAATKKIHVLRTFTPKSQQASGQFIELQKGQVLDVSLGPSGTQVDWGHTKIVLAAEESANYEYV